LRGWGELNYRKRTHYLGIAESKSSIKEKRWFNKKKDLKGITQKKNAWDI
jgi:hypothetical protein